jgi:hypothetical protein
MIRGLADGLLPRTKQWPPDLPRGCLAAERVCRRIGWAVPTGPRATALRQQCRHARKTSTRLKTLRRITWHTIPGSVSAQTKEENPSNRRPRSELLRSIAEPPETLAAAQKTPAQAWFWSRNSRRTSSNSGVTEGAGGWIKTGALERVRQRWNGGSMRLPFPGARGQGVVTGRIQSQVFSIWAAEHRPRSAPMPSLCRQAGMANSRQHGLPDIVLVQLRSLPMSMANSSQATKSR